MKNKAILLSSSFEVEGLLASSLDRLERVLSLNPSLKLLSRGTRLRYKITDSDGTGRIVEFERNVIRFTFYFEGPIAGVYNNNLAVFLAILGMVEGSYQIMLSSLYGYIIDALKNSFGGSVSGEQSRTIERQATMLEAQGLANRQLSRALFDCKREFDALKGALAIYKSFCVQVIEHLSRDKAAVRKELIGTLGVDEGTSDRVLQDLNKSEE